MKSSPSSFAAFSQMTMPASWLDPQGPRQAIEQHRAIARQERFCPSLLVRPSCSVALILLCSAVEPFADTIYLKHPRDIALWPLMQYLTCAVK